MTYRNGTKILIDNATISSVQRALGKAPLRDPSLLDIEHVALARFSEAVLLSDNIVIPDNYKAELSASRKALVSGEAFSFQPIEEGQDEAIGKICTALSTIFARGL